MKFSTYNPVVAPNKMQGSAVQGVTMPMPHAVSPVDGSKGYSAMAAAFGQITGFLQKKQDEDDAADVMKARNEIMTSLTGQLYGENGIMTTGVGENAKGLTDRVSQAINETFDKVAQNYNPRVRRALQGNLNENMANYQRLAGQQEGREFTRQKEINYNSALSLNADNIAANYMDSDSIDGLLNDSMTLINYRGKDQGWSGLQLEQEKRLKVTALVGGAIDNAITDGNLDQADMLLGRYRGSMSADAVMKYDLRLRGEEGIKISREMGEDLYAKFGNDTEAARKYIYDTLSAEVETVGGGGGGNISSIDGLMAAIGGQESGGDYDAENGRTGAHGKYQIMPENWPSWAEEAGLGADAPRTPENQEKVAKYKLSQYLQQYGPEGAMVAWYSGPANAERWASGESTDIYGRSWDAPNGNGDEPSIREYVQQVTARGGKSGAVDLSDIPTQDIEDKGLAKTNNTLKRQFRGLYDWAVQQFGKKVEISGGARSEEHNRAVNGSPTSHHLRGNALDVNVEMLTEEERDEFIAEAERRGFNSGGDDFYHNRGSGYHVHLTYEDDGSAGGGGYTRRKYSEKQLDAIWQQYNARVNDGKRQQAAATKERTDAYIGQLGSMNEAQAGELLERLRAGISTKEDSDIYSAVLSAANNKFNGAFTKKAMSGGGSGTGRSGSGKYQKPYIYGESGERYTPAQVRKAQRTIEKWWKAVDPNNPDPVKESLQDQADEASVVLKDIGYEGGADVDAQREAYEKLQTTARNVWDEAQDYDEAVRILVEEYGWSETNAITILDALPDKE